MKTVLKPIFYMVSLFFLTCTTASYGANEIILSVKKNKWVLLKKSPIIQSFGTVLKEELLVADTSHDIYLLEMSPILVLNNFIDALVRFEDVLWAEANMYFVGDPREGRPDLMSNLINLLPNDPYYKKQYHHKIIHADKVWDQLELGEDVVVAVTDDGFDLAHEDLSSVYYRNSAEIADNGIDDDNNGYIDDTLGWDFNENDNNPSYDALYGGHGTHIAGTLAAVLNNGIGVSGTSPRIKIMPLKFYGTNGWSTAMILRAYKYAVDQGARIISTSYGIDSFIDSNTYHAALDYAYSRDVLVFNSAGNNNVEQPPRVGYEKIFLVASVQSVDNPSWQDIKSLFSNYGYGVDITAPGDPIYATLPGNKYGYMKGTSMATPVAAGIAAAIWSLNSDWSGRQVVATLTGTADNLAKKNPDFLNKLGAGRVNIARAVMSDTRPPRIIKSWYDQELSELSILLEGVLQGEAISEAFEIECVSDPQIKPSMIVERYYYGTNILKIKFHAPGGEGHIFRLRIIAENLLDPFGVALDGDGDGFAGGDYEFEFARE